MRLWLLSLLLVVGLLTSAVSARAQERVYSYDVVHPFYGAIGTFTEIIARNGDTTRVESHVRVAVKIWVSSSIARKAITLKSFAAIGSSRSRAPRRPTEPASMSEVKPKASILW